VKMERVIETLHELSDHIIVDDLIQRIDAFALTNIDLHEEAATTAQLQIVKLNGLQTISKEITDIFTFGLIHQQAILTRLRSEFNQTCESVEQMKLKYDNRIDQKNDWESLPPATSSGEFSDLLTHEHSTTIAVLKKEFHPRFQKHFDDAFAILQTKTKAFELVDAILCKYTGQSISASLFHLSVRWSRKAGRGVRCRRFGAESSADRQSSHWTSSHASFHGHLSGNDTLPVYCPTLNHSRQRNSSDRSKPRSRSHTSEGIAISRNANSHDRSFSFSLPLVVSDSQQTLVVSTRRHVELPLAVVQSRCRPCLAPLGDL
jgi:hypothetical protein